jgi:hypothetical protein
VIASNRITNWIYLGANPSDLQGTNKKEIGHDAQKSNCDRSGRDAGTNDSRRYRPCPQW